MTFTSGFVGGFGLATVSNVKKDRAGAPQLTNRVVALRAGTMSQPLGFGLGAFDASPFGS